MFDTVERIICFIPSSGMHATALVAAGSGLACCGGVSTIPGSVPMRSKSMVQAVMKQKAISVFCRVKSRLHLITVIIGGRTACGAGMCTIAILSSNHTKERKIIFNS